MSENPILYYGHDPMCSYCWAFRPVWRIIKKSVSLDFPHIDIISLLGGLAPDSNEPMPKEVRRMVYAAWRNIEQNIPGTKFNFDYWDTQKPRRSTYPACRAVSAVKLLNPYLEDEIILAIQQAYYVNAQNPSNDDTLMACAKSIGIDIRTFGDVYHSAACNEVFINEMRFSRKLGISSFPDIVLAQGNSRVSIPIEYINAESMLEIISQAVNNLEA